MKKWEALQLAFLDDEAAYLCFLPNGKLLWVNEAAMQRGFLPDADLFSLFPGLQEQLLTEKNTTYVPSPLQCGGLRLTCINREQEAFYLACWDETINEKPGERGESALVQQFSGLVRQHVGHLTMMMDVLAEKLNEDDLRTSAQLYDLNQDALRLLKAIYNWDALRAVRERETLCDGTVELQPLLQELLYDAALLTAEGKLTVRSDLQVEQVRLFADGDVLQIAILNLISIALANSFRKDGGQFSLSAHYRDGWVQFVVADDLTAEMAEGENHESWTIRQKYYGGMNYKQQTVTLLREFVSLHGGQFLLLSEENGYRMVFTLPGKEELRLHSQGDYFYRKPGKGRFSLPQVILSDCGNSWY